MRSFAGPALSFNALVVAIILLSASAVMARNANPLPGLKGPPMTVVLVKGPAGCTDNCHEWISAEGPIFPDTDSVFRKVLKSIGKRSVPIMINSPGGSVDAALAIGRMLRSRHLDISVTRTLFDGCSPADSTCSHVPGFKGYTGAVSSFGAFCASACAYVVAGGEHRYVSSGSFVGVHSVITFERHISRKYEVETRTENGKKVEVGRRLVSETASDPYKVDPDKTRALFFKKLANYYKEMGIGDQLIDLTFATPATSIHVMSRLELIQTRLMTVPLGGEAIVGYNPPRAAPPSVPQAARVGEVLQRAPTISQPEPPLAPPTLTSGLEFVDIPAVTLPEGYDVALNFAHRLAAPTVSWTAIVHQGGVTQPKSNFALRLDLGDGRGLTASPSISDPVTTDALRGEMSLVDYCGLATNDRVRVRLSAKQNGNYAMRELLGTPQELLAGHKIWSACATYAAAKIPDPAPDPAPPIEKTLQSQAASRDVDIAETYRMDLTFERYRGAGNVAWFAIVHKGDLELPKQLVAVRLEFPDGHIASASASLADAARPASIEGEMSLQDFCAIANGATMRTHLSATSPALHGTRDVTGGAKVLPAPLPAWPDCAQVKSATLRTAAPTPAASPDPKPAPSP